MFCPKCGNQNREEAVFCDSCGANLSRNEDATMSEASQINQASATSASVQSDEVLGSTAVLKVNRKGRFISIAMAVMVVVLVIVAFVTGGFGLFGGVKSSVNEYSWNELSAISSEISKASSEEEAIEIAKKYNLVNTDGKLDGTQTKSVTLSDGKTVQVQIAGFYHDNKTDVGKAGITFIFKDAIAEHRMNSSRINAGGWEDSRMRSWLASDGMNILPDDLRSKIVAVDKVTNNTGQTKNVSSVTSTSDKLWLFSYVELCGVMPKSEYSSSYAYIDDIFQAEGSEYKLFKDCNVSKNSENSILTKHYNGNSTRWWERSPSPYNSDDFYNVLSDGCPHSADYALLSHSVVPGFCI